MEYIMVLCGLRCLKGISTMLCTIFGVCCELYTKNHLLLLFAFANSIHNPMFKKHIVQFRKIEKKEHQISVIG